MLATFQLHLFTFLSAPEEGSVLSLLLASVAIDVRFLHVETKQKYQIKTAKCIIFINLFLSLWLCLYNVPTKSVNLSNSLVWIERKKIILGLEQSQGVEVIKKGKRPTYGSKASSKNWTKVEKVWQML